MVNFKMEPEVIQVFHIYPESCEDLFRYSVSSEIRDSGCKGISIDLEERSSKLEPYSISKTISFSVEESKALLNCIKLMLQHLKKQT